MIPILILLLHSLRPSNGVIPICDPSSPDFSENPYCIPSDYNKDVVPPTIGPLKVHVDIWVFEVSKIDDISLTMTFELYFDLTWNESRLLIDESSPKWGSDGSIMGSTNFISGMWLPDVQILNLKQFQKRQIVTDVSGLILFKNRSVLYTVSTEAIISCPMKFSAYPLDRQECKFHVGSYIHDASQIFFTGTYGHDVVNQRAQQYEINITDLDPEDKMVKWAGRDYSQTGFKIKMNRRRTPVLLQTYLPSGLFVIVSWISFIVPPEVVPGRMALLVTLFLVLVNIFNSVTANAPKSEGLTAVETWVVMCILHVFAVLAEYSCILKILQSERSKISSTKKLNGIGRIDEEEGRSDEEGSYKMQRRSSCSFDYEDRPPYTERVYEGSDTKGYDNSHSVGRCKHRNNPSIPIEEINSSKRSRDDSLDRTSPRGFFNVRSKVRCRYEKIDRMALYLFPFFFFVFNFCYWSYYLIFYDIFQELWK